MPKKPTPTSKVKITGKATAVPAPKPPASGTKSVTRGGSFVASPKIVTKSPTPKATMTPKPKATPMPKFTAPTLAQYKSSAAYKAGNMTYKQYIAASKSVFDAKNR
jgi:hypothetical protein